MQDKNNPFNLDSPVTDGRVAYNLGAKQLEIIGNLLSQASSHAISGNVHRYFNTLHSLKLQIVARLNREDCKNLAKIEKAILGHLSSKSRDPWNDVADDYTDVMPHLFEYDALLKRLLEHRGYLIPGQEKTNSVFGEE